MGDGMYEAFDRDSSWDYLAFLKAKVGGIGCRTEGKRIDVGTILAPWR